MSPAGDGAALFLSGFAICLVIAAACWFFDIVRLSEERQQHCYVCNVDLCDFFWCGSRKRDVEGGRAEEGAAGRGRAGERDEMMPGLPGEHVSGEY